jgi:hypothetical protein
MRHCTLLANGTEVIVVVSGPRLGGTMVRDPQVDLLNRINGKNVIVLSLPGAFTPT